jgi:hypothetical protein
LDLIRVIESDKDLAPTEQVCDVFRFPALAAMPAGQPPDQLHIDQDMRAPRVRQLPMGVNLRT